MDVPRRCGAYARKLAAGRAVGLLFLAVGILGSSAVVLSVGAVFLAAASWWTINKVRTAREGLSIQRYADSRPHSRSGGA